MRAGDVLEIDFGVPAGSEPGFVRPAVAVTADLILQARPRTIHVVPLTSNTSRALPTEVIVSAPGLEHPSAAQCHLCTVVSMQRVTADRGGNIGTTSLAQVRSVLGELLDIA
ncbi:MAG TPA: type II toxin-antitoxin system PemK/MazF family toxin [Acidimicrobiales bacterium]|jgi:mRNA interferase MazF|nr:type II toxin-antitoxin system PemK/MazF family toxin [Acidimicrobiales bacterium]